MGISTPTSGSSRVWFGTTCMQTTKTPCAHFTPASSLGVLNPPNHSPSPTSSTIFFSTQGTLVDALMEVQSPSSVGTSPMDQAPISLHLQVPRPPHHHHPHSTPSTVTTPHPTPDLYLTLSCVQSLVLIKPELSSNTLLPPPFSLYLLQFTTLNLIILYPVSLPSLSTPSFTVVPFTLLDT